MKKSTKALLAAGAVAGAGVAIGVTRQRSLKQRAHLGDEVPFGTVHSSARDTRDIRADDGVRLHVEIDGDELSGATLVFTHGYVENVDVWHYPRLALRDKYRMVFFDHRSHGASGRSPIDHITMGQLAADLKTVIDETTDGPVILIGHSMGGMTIMEFARNYPEYFDHQVKAAILINTSSGRLMVTNPTFHRLAPLVRRGSPVVTWARGAVTRPAIRGILTGPDIRAEHVDMIEKMVHRTSPSTFTHFSPLFTTLDTSEGFPTLGQVPTTVVGGVSDRLTPISHSRYIAKKIPGANLVELDRVGHFSMFENAERVIEVIETVAEKVAADQ
ncbi:MAG: alpha/beta fold hydrolase [Aeromicrobium sp.]